ncbi:uncharacterized protein DUF2779 [Metamycoplasma subdolum]|uniref:Uncharacterized protein DUF2779 n=1 Tax=Metamycoplasma subdolum TaxID=92407 RepID=A0A3L9ZX55_9BACT|nr:DUF2779 domain-containing protein [Metamycoplasma subdolum]RMA77451.1 uncharacterized protein DUF2779 [Metamycoplasma subdolum]WPB50320.1 DUF2779 domain-containing protein [Metamycoplasma subdolum]
MEKPKYFNFNHFAIACQIDPYFIFNLDHFNLDETDKVALENSEIGETLFDEDDEGERPTISYVKANLDAISQEIQNFILNEFKNYNVEIISLKETKENKILQTKEAIKNPKIDVIINPTFEYKNVVVAPLYYSKIDHSFANNTISKMQNNKQIIQAYFQGQVILKSGVKISNYYLYMFKQFEVKKARKNLVSFEKVNRGVNKKTKGNINIDGENLENEFPIFNDVIFGNKSLQEIFGKKEKFIWSFDHFLRSINDEKNWEKNNEIDQEFLKIYFKEKPFESKLCNRLLEAWRNKLYSQKKSWGKKIFKIIYDEKTTKNQQLINNILAFYNPSNNLKNIYFNNNLWNKFLISQKLEKKSEDLIDFFKALDVLNYEEKNIAWFDFEGFQLTWPIIDYLPAWRQVISQLSIITTYRKNVVKNVSEDFVYDPLNYSYKTIVKIINDIYKKDVDYYVVYNQGYEKTRIKEMLETLKCYAEDKTNDFTTEEYLEIETKGKEIIKKMADLHKLYVNSSPQLIKKPVINLGFLGGKSSIKLLEKFVHASKLKLKHEITPYNELEVQNGSMAMEIAQARAQNKIGNLEWEDICKNLRKYCHNDVVAMIMVADLSNWIIQNSEKNNELVDKLLID